MASISQQQNGRTSTTAPGASPSLRTVALLTFLTFAVSLSAQAPPLMSYQGRLTASSTNFDGPALFKFALVNGSGTVTLWSNDNSSSGGAEPTLSVPLTVAQGLFTVMLGDSTLSNMQPIPASPFTNPDVRLRIWVSTGTNAFQLLVPDQRLGAVGYAMLAATVPDGTLTGAKLAPGSVQTANLANGAITSLQLAPNAVSSLNLASASVTSFKLAPASVNSAAIAPAAVGLSNLNFTLGYVNAQNPPYLAKGDGVSDDTAAIQTALNDAGSKGGGIVFLPLGNYYIASHLSVPAQTTLSGIWRIPTAYSQNKGTTLLAVENAGNTSGVPFITLQGANSTLEGVTIFYPEQVQNNPPTAYPWAIRAGGGDNVTIQNVLMVNPYLGVDFATHASGRHLIRSLYGQPLRVGIAVDQCYDIGRIMDVHFWPFWSNDANVRAFVQNNGVSFDFMRTDWEVVQDIFSLGYAIGARFRASASGAMNGQMSNVNFDGVDIGLQLLATQPYVIHISNLNIANSGGGANRIGIQALPGTNCDLNVNGASFWGSILQGVSWNNAGLFSLSNARFINWSASLPAIDIISGRAMLQGNYFKDGTATAIHVGAGTDRGMIMANELAGNTLSLQGPKTLSANNHP
jgi:hypothetical protein